MVTLREPPQPKEPDLFPSYWFTRLEQAVSDGDFDQAAEASRNLKRFGIVVRYPRPLFNESPSEPAS